jgi:hypothetical protein
MEYLSDIQTTLSNEKSLLRSQIKGAMPLHAETESALGIR